MADNIEVQIWSLATKVEWIDATMTEMKQTLLRMESRLISKEEVMLHIQNVEQKNELRHQKNEATISFISKALWGVVVAIGWVLLKGLSDFITRS